MRQYLSVAGAGRLLGLSSAAIRALANRGALRVAAQTDAGARLFNAVDVERLVQRRRELAKSGRAGQRRARRDR